MRRSGIEVRRAAQGFRTQAGEMSTHHSFSFGAHYDPGNVSFGPLMVCNDDVVRPGPGYAAHPHADAEIVTWVLSGSLVHQDSAGHRAVVHPGVVQRLSAGSGIVHQERNDAYLDDPGRQAEPVHFVQMWLRPDQPGVTPSYQQRSFDLNELAGDWLPVASGRQDGVVGLGSAGSTLWAGVIAPGQTRVVPAGDLAHLYVARGRVGVAEAGELSAGDSVRLVGQAGLTVTARAEAELLVWTMAA